MAERDFIMDMLESSVKDINMIMQQFNELMLHYTGNQKKLIARLRELDAEE